jgi:chorismate synthase
METNSFGRKYRITIFGESHGPGIGVVVDGIPSGIEIDSIYIQAELNRRRPGQSSISTPRNEEDRFEFISGVQDGKSTGAAIAMMIRNKDTRSKDYDLFRKLPRPSHSDYPAILRYGQAVDLRGGGKFSGRITAGIVMAGAIAKQILFSHNVKLAGYVDQVGDIRDRQEYSVEEIHLSVEQNIVRTIKSDIAQRMIALIEQVKVDSDSIGGAVSIRIENFPPGIGDPWFHSLETDLAAGVMSIPATRGIEFGTGFQAASMRGSEHNDPYIWENGVITTKSNHAGGVIGGISVGTPITFRVAIKPTASIGKTQSTLNIETKQTEELKIEGRHDPCIVPRALIAIEAITAIVLVDHLLISKSY